MRCDVHCGYIVPHTIAGSSQCECPVETEECPKKSDCQLRVREESKGRQFYV